MFEANSNLKLYSRIQMPEVTIGSVVIGGDNPIALQSMTNTNTNDVDASIEQCIRVFEAGGDYVRLTAQGIKEAESLQYIKKGLVSRGYNNPLVADIHFNPKAAIVAAQYVEKVRINPGNYVALSSLTKIDYTEDEYIAELEKIRQNILPLLEVCKQHNTAIRIGVNHGSLSQRIVSKYGDTPLGMVMSMMEFLHICKDADFYNVVCSIKASNTRIMVYATRLLADTMQKDNCMFPIHLGVTEAGAGEDGRIKSAVGIGTLLIEGIGDTIRVSLTEAPEKEIPVCKAIVSYRNEVFSDSNYTIIPKDVRLNPFAYSKRISKNVYGIGADNPPIVISTQMNIGADYILQCKSVLSQEDGDNELSYVSLNQFDAACYNEKICIEITSDDIFNLKNIYLPEECILVFTYSGKKIQYWIQKLYAELEALQAKPPVILHLQYDNELFEELQIHASIDAGSIFIDGFCDGLFIENPNFPEKLLVDLSFSILQASRSRFTKTEFISCPSCGRTLFNIEQALADVQSKTNHLQGLKIAVMGCIVNGPGEMADADYGYVGAGRGTVNLYRKKELVRKGIPENEAVETLIQVIRENGDWKES